MKRTKRTDKKEFDTVSAIRLFVQPVCATQDFFNNVIENCHE